MPLLHGVAKRQPVSCCHRDDSQLSNTAVQLPGPPHGPAVWQILAKEELMAAIDKLLQEEIETRARCDCLGPK